MGVFVEEDQKRKMVEIALFSARKRLSAQTGFVHFYQEDPQNPQQDTIAVVENFLYVHALFRSRLMENVQEGKILLEKLMAFEVEGNFPVYLHEFPKCLDSQLSSRILPPLFYLLRDFSAILGEALFERLHKTASNIKAYLYGTLDKLSMGAKSRLFAFDGCFNADMWEPETPSQWAEYCLCCQMSGLLPSKAIAYWDSNFFTFIGPCKERWQEGLEPMVTLLDLFMGEYYRKFSVRALLPNIVHLQASLVYPFLEEGNLQEGSPFTALISPEKKQCFTLYFGSQARTHSLVVEAKKGQWDIASKEEGVFRLVYTYDQQIPSEEDNVECALYVNEDPECKIFVNEVKATVFHKEDTVHVLLGGKDVQIQFSSEEGAWMGHISHANRSFQKSHSSYATHDWKIGWRTIRRPAQAKVFLDIKIQ